MKERKGKNSLAGNSLPKSQIRNSLRKYGYHSSWKLLLHVDTEQSWVHLCDTLICIYFTES